jgi:hypothetical protein
VSGDIPVRIAKTVDVDSEAFIQLATELLDELDGMKALLPRMVAPGLKESNEAGEDWTWRDVVRNWVDQRLEGA